MTKEIERDAKKEAEKQARKEARKKMNRKIGARIKAAREASGYSQEKFAEKVGLSIQHVSNLERGVAGPSIDVVIKMCKVLNVSCDYLLLGRSSSRDVSKVESRLTDLTPDQLFIVDRAIRIVLEAFDCPDGEEMPPDHQQA